MFVKRAFIAVPVLAATCCSFAAAEDRGTQWEELRTILSDATGRYTEAPPVEKVVTNLFTAGMLLGNGGFGVVCDARKGEQSYYMSGNDVWNNGQKIMNAQLRITAATADADVPQTTVTRYHAKSSDTLLFHSEAANAFDSREATGWYSDTQARRVDGKKVPHDKWVMVDAPGGMMFDRLEIRHYGSRFPEYSCYNTYDYQIQVSDDGWEWNAIKTVRANTDNINTFLFDKPVTTRFLRMYITMPVKPEYATRHYPDDMTGARVIDINLFMGENNVINPVAEWDGKYLQEQDILNAEVRSRVEMGGGLLHFRAWTADDRNLLVTDVRLDKRAASPVRLRAHLTNVLIFV